MVLSRSLKKENIFPLILFLLPVFAFSQEVNRVISPGKEISGISSATPDHSLFAGAGFGSNMICLGSTISQNQPYYYGSIAYGFRNKFFASVSPVHLPGSYPFFAFYIGSVTYNHTFNSWFDITAGIYRYQIAKSLSDTLFTSFTYADLTFGFDWKILYSKVSVGGLQSEENQFYFQVRNSKYFQTRDFVNGKVSLAFDPYANLLFGSLIKLESTTETTVIASLPGRKWKKYTNYTTTTNNSFVKKFGLTEADFGIPVSLNADKFTVEAEINYTLPFYDTPLISGPKGFVFMLTLFFRIL